MTSLASVRYGAQEARLRSVPPYVQTSGGEVAELAASAGLHLLPWQAQNLTDALGEDERGQWTAFEVAEVVSRQNGKGGEIEARELGGLFLFGEKLIVHTAHEYKTAAEAFLRVKALIENTDDLIRKCRKPRTANGEQGIELLPQFGGGRLRFVARSEGSGRGFSGDCVILDEAYALTAGHMAALLPTLSTRPNPQVWYTSTVGGELLHTVRQRALKGDPGLCYHEHSAAPRPCASGDCTHDPDDPGCFYNDRDAWAQANPSMGYLIPEAFIERERRAMAHDVAKFAVERLSIWPDARSEAVIDMDAWESSALLDPESKVTGRVAFAIDMPLDRSVASIGGCGLRADGVQHVELIQRADGSGWVPARAKHLQDKYDAPVVVDPSSAAGSLIPALESAGVTLTLVSGREYAQACGALYDAVGAGDFRHIGQPEMTAALVSAKKRPLGDAWAWDRKGLTDISPLVAVTLAKHGLDVVPAAYDPMSNIW